MSMIAEADLSTDQRTKLGSLNSNVYDAVAALEAYLSDKGVAGFYVEELKFTEDSSKAFKATKDTKISGCCCCTNGCYMCPCNCA